MPDRIAVVRQMFDLWSEGAVDQILDAVHPDFELLSPRTAWTAHERYRGPGGLAAWMSEAPDGKRSVSIVPSSFRELPDGRVLVLGLLIVPQDEQQVRFAGWICEVADGRLWRVVSYLDREDALREAGLEESGESSDTSLREG